MAADTGSPSTEHSDAAQVIAAQAAERERALREKIMRLANEAGIDLNSWPWADGLEMHCEG